MYGPKHAPNFETLNGKVVPIYGREIYRGRGDI
jgi:hypothetical protein